MSIYATDWEYTTEPRSYIEGVHHLVSGITSDGRRIDLVEVQCDYDDCFEARMPDDDAAQIARLIAAAPDLLAALFGIVDNIEPDQNDPERGRVLSSGFVQWDSLIDAARAAIAKAEGSE